MIQFILLEINYIGFPGVVTCRSDVGSIGAVFLFDRIGYIGYNMLNKGAGR